jgi:hypothetical protein
MLCTLRLYCKFCGIGYTITSLLLYPKMKLFFPVVLSLVSSATATGPVPVSRSGLAGINGFTFYDPYCGHGCFRSFSPFKLTCSGSISPGGHTTQTEAAQNLALCRASNFPYLSSIAWCIHLYCSEDVLASKIERFWETEITGDIKVIPEWSFGEVMANITDPPTMVAINQSMILNTTVLTTYDTWQLTWITLYYFFRETALESYFGYVVQALRSCYDLFYLIELVQHSIITLHL